MAFCQVRGPFWEAPHRRAGAIRTPGISERGLVLADWLVAQEAPTNRCEFLRISYEHREEGGLGAAAAAAHPVGAADAPWAGSAPAAGDLTDARALPGGVQDL